MLNELKEMRKNVATISFKTGELTGKLSLSDNPDYELIGSLVDELTILDNRISKLISTLEDTNSSKNRWKCFNTEELFIITEELELAKARYKNFIWFYKDGMDDLGVKQLGRIDKSKQKLDIIICLLKEIGF